MLLANFSGSNERLRAVDEKVTGAKQDAVIGGADGGRVKVEVTAMHKVVKDIVAQLQGDRLSLASKWSGRTNLESAASSAAEASAVAHASVRAVSEVSSIADEIKKKVESQHESLQLVQTRLTDISASTSNKISNATFEACSNSLSAILQDKSSDAIRHIAGFNMILLADLNATLHKIDVEADAIDQNLSDVSSKVKEANSSA
ncbi:hypothetical protein ERJ75_001481700 [Trypanosoma vivax]|nr:hypothetical protein ERJ75_001481700 [Trypanosoma vivax]